jgi:hypothetical protein
MTIRRDNMRYQDKLYSAFVVFLLTFSFAAVIFLNEHQVGEGKSFDEDAQIVIDAFQMGYFQKNDGQWNEEVHFLIDLTYGKVAFCEDGIRIISVKSRESNRDTSTGIKTDINGSTQAFQRIDVIGVRFVGTSGVIPQGIGKTSHYNNYFSGSGEDSWFTNVPSFNEIIYEDVWEGIDIVYRSQEGSLKYDVVIKPGADFSEVKFEVLGEVELEVASDSVSYLIPTGEVISETWPISYYEDVPQEIIDVRYCRIDDRMFGFDIETYNTARTIVIDPPIYSTYFGGSDFERSEDIAIDSTGAAYILGYTFSKDLPITPGAYSDHVGDFDVFILKMDMVTKQLLYASYLGGSNNDFGTAVEINSMGEIFGTGYTYSTDFPVTKSAYNDTHYNTSDTADVFAFKLVSSGSILDQSTYLGGEKEDRGYDLEIGELGEYIITGYTESKNFPTTNGAYKDKNEKRDVFVTIIDFEGIMDLRHSSIFGGVEDEEGYGIEFDGKYYWVTGWTTSHDFPVTSDSHLPNYIGNFDAFVFKFSLSLDDLVFSTYLASAGDEEGIDLFVDNFDYVYVTGYTEGGGMLFPFYTTPGAYDGSFNGERDIFICKLNPGGDTLVASTFVGSDKGDYSQSITMQPQAPLIRPLTVDKWMGYSSGWTRHLPT